MPRIIVKSYARHANAQKQRLANTLTLAREVLAVSRACSVRCCGRVCQLQTVHRAHGD